MVVKANLFLATCVLAGLALPAAGLADPPSDAEGRSNGHDQSGQPHGGGGGQRPVAAQRGAVPAAVAPMPSNGQRGRPGGGQTPPFRQRGGQGSTQGAQPAWNPAPRAVASPPPNANAAVRTRGRWTRPAQNAPQDRPTTIAPLGDWNRTVRGPDRDQAGQQWRRGHAGWDNHAPWRRSSDWWRGNSAFRLFSGSRIGFLFIPERGYISAPDQYRDHYWRAGEFLPQWFWQYGVRDYWRYELPQPPDGCAWIWLDGDVALIDLEDGYILDVVHNLW